MNGQAIITLGLILLASLIILGRFRKVFNAMIGRKAAGSSCGGGCAGCPSATSNPIVQLSLTDNQGLASGPEDSARTR
jgi:hypothetical protein